MDRVKQLLANLSTRGKLALGGAAMAFIIFAFVMFRIAGAPSYTQVATGIDPAETGKITAALDERGVGYEIQNNGTALAVEKSQMGDARIALAEQGLPGKGQEGWELFNKSKLGASDFEQQVTYQRALEGEISKTLSEIDGVNGVRVQLTLPDEDLFVDEQKKATAAVMLSGSENLEPASIKGMASLVASSVEGLATGDVTITSETGQLLWPNGDAAGGMGSGSKAAVQSRYERELEANLNAMLVRAIGPDKGQVQVNADLNADRATQEQLKYDRTAVPLKEKTEDERLQGGGAPGAGGVAGTTGNVAPTYGGAVGGGGADSKYNRKTGEIENGVGKTVTRTTVAPGTVEKQSVAVLLDSSVAAKDADELRRTLTAAAGIDRQRGDKLSLSQIKFTKPAEPAKPSAAAGMMGYLKYVALGLLTLVFLFLLTRHLRRRENQELSGEPAWLREISSPMTLAQLEARSRGGAQPIAELAAVPANPEREAVESADSDRLAGQVRAWMKDD